MLERYQALYIAEDSTISVGTTQRLFPPEAPKGLADHLILDHRPGEPARYHYYDPGTYNPTNYTFTYNPNGNVTVLVNATDQSLSAQYEYSPFGDVLRATGPLARSNPFRFSTKFLDEETDLVYYGYRYYSPSLMRWIGRDPIEEEGGINFYAFLRNNSIYAVDLYGLTALEGIKNVRRLHNLVKQLDDILKVFKNPALEVSARMPATRLLSGGAYAMLFAATAVAEGAADIIGGTTAI